MVGHYYKLFVGVRGFPGVDKIWCMVYCMLYTISKWLNIITTAMMWKRAPQLSEIHLYYFLKLPIKDNLAPRICLKLSLLAFLFKITKLDFCERVM